ncbi:MAG: Mrp/NBP35 family ATP-binding protein [Mucispirillum sp.]|uniref:Iron-sulfur cluster carrier protein n=1 Tax=Candidatus Mucispirillum faecigallinarum TaxID=2838699 RepID=A0A9D2GSB8_9BACT|nr:Mrp/NBP35 family ATP-binding protein [Mucispirillum sp.]HIZ89082.1 Mrp/NBP35 family ATP-binding protein [Candidatus Mucispirillum faecigallinarum]
MSSDSCSHNCGSCGEDCGDRSAESTFEKLNPFSSVKKVIGIVSGKGGVGKSLVTSLMAVMAQRKGLNAAILDADITGPSIPKSFGVSGRAMASQQGMLPSVSKKGTQIMSLNLISENETDPVIWRGPVIAGVVKQFWTDVVWKDVDIMFIDMPPGTGDVPLTVFQSIPVDGIIIVSSPQELVGMIVEKAVNMAAMMNIPVLALVENMSYFKCPDCGKEIKIFGESNMEKIAKKHNISLTARIPIDPQIASLVDAGNVEEVNVESLNKVLDAVIAK